MATNKRVNTVPSKKATVTNASEEKAPKRRSRGQPTKYIARYCEAIVDYFNKPPQQVVYKKAYYEDGTLKSEIPVVLPAELPTMQGFAHSIGVDTNTLRRWNTIHADFMVAYTQAKELQENIWLINAMSGQYNSGFAQFFGKNCLGYRDKVENEMSGGIRIELSPEVSEYAK